MSQPVKQSAPFLPGYTTYRVGRSDWYIDLRDDGRESANIRNERTGRSTGGIRYTRGGCAYDRPEILPVFVRVAFELLTAH